MAAVWPGAAVPQPSWWLPRCGLCIRISSQRQAVPLLGGRQVSPHPWETAKTTETELIKHGKTRLPRDEKLALCIAPRPSRTACLTRADDIGQNPRFLTLPSCCFVWGGENLCPLRLWRSAVFMGRAFNVRMMLMMTTVPPRASPVEIAMANSIG